MGALFSVTDELNQNISASQKELLLWHWQHCHAGLDWIQTLMKPRKQEIGVPAEPPILQARHDATPCCDMLMCCACQLGKQTHRTTGATVTRLRPS